MRNTLGGFLAVLYTIWDTRINPRPAPPAFDPRKVAVRRPERVTAGGETIESDTWMDEVNDVVEGAWQSGGTL